MQERAVRQLDVGVLQVFRHRRSGLQIDAENGLPFQIRDSKNLELDNVTTRRPMPGEPVIRLDHCPGAIVRNSRAFEETGTFLSVGAGELKNVVLEGNVLRQAKTPTEESAKQYRLTAENPTEKQ